MTPFLVSPLLLALLSGAVIMLVSLVGVLTTWRNLGAWTQRYLKYLVSFSAGTFFIVALGLSQEAFEFSRSDLIASLTLLLGAALIFIAGRFMPESHHHHEPDNLADIHDQMSARRILWGDALHNAGDGLLLAPAFIVDIRLGIATAFGVLVHEAIQEVSEFFVLRQGGYSVRQALLRNFLVSSTVLIGIILGFTLSSLEMFIGPLLGIAAGAFFFIVLNDLIPRSVANSANLREYSTHALAGLLGALLMVGVNYISGHEHQNEMERYPSDLAAESTPLD